MDSIFSSSMTQFLFCKTGVIAVHTTRDHHEDWICLAQCLWHNTPKILAIIIAKRLCILNHEEKNDIYYTYNINYLSSFTYLILVNMPSSLYYGKFIIKFMHTHIMLQFNPQNSPMRLLLSSPVYRQRKGYTERVTRSRCHALKVAEWKASDPQVRALPVHQALHVQLCPYIHTQQIRW